jgi:hypothetical protein
MTPVCRFIALRQSEVKGSREYQRKLGVAKQKYLEDRHQQQAKGKRDEKSSAQKGRSEEDLSADEATQRMLQKEIDEILARYHYINGACRVCVCVCVCCRS